MQFNVDVKFIFAVEHIAIPATMPERRSRHCGSRNQTGSRVLLNAAVVWVPTTGVTLPRNYTAQAYAPPTYGRQNSRSWNYCDNNENSRRVAGSADSVPSRSTDRHSESPTQIGTLVGSY